MVISFLLNLNYRLKLIALIIGDISIIFSALGISIWLQGSVSDLFLIFNQHKIALVSILTIRGLCFYGRGLYRQVWRHASVKESFLILQAVSLGSLGL